MLFKIKKEGYIFKKVNKDCKNCFDVNILGFNKRVRY